MVQTCGNVIVISDRGAWRRCCRSWTESGRSRLGLNSMPTVTINDDVLNAEPGDNLLALARRKASHIWFLCDGRGLCQTCECRILSGVGNLSAPSKIELDSISITRREQGYRLACQSRVTGNGPVNLITVTEEMRRQAVDLLGGSEKGAWTENAGKLAGTLTNLSLDFTRSLPSVALNAIPQIISMPPDLRRIELYFRDTRRVAERLFRDVKTLI